MDWKSLLFGKEELEFLLNTGFRTVIMFLVLLTSLRLLGKRGIHQLSVFELGVIIGLGSAAGDPMFYKDVGILTSVVVFIVVISMYRLVTYLISKNEKFERLIEGKATYVMKDGVILEGFKNQPLAKDELFATLRQSHVYQLGQIESAIIESDGQISVFYYPDEKVKYGLPILPDLLNKNSRTISEEGIYSCYSCGNTEGLKPITGYLCPACKNDTWVMALNGKRIR